MKQILLRVFFLRFITMAILFFGSTTAIAQITPEPQWFACQEDSDCVVESDACRLVEIVNKKYLGDYRAWRTEISAVVDCGAEAGDGGRTLADAGKRKARTPICNKGRCSLPVGVGAKR